MKKLTKKQRKEVYIEAIINLENKKGGLFICSQLNEIYSQKYKYPPNITNITNFFPEFLLFRPDFEQKETDTAAWWKTDKDGMNQRITCLCFCISIFG